MNPRFVYNSLPQALGEGWQVFDRQPGGYLLRRKNERGLWELALVDLAR